LYKIYKFSSSLYFMFQIPQFWTMSLFVDRHNNMLHNYFLIHLKIGSQESTVSTAIGYGLGSWGLHFNSQWGKYFSPLHVLQNGSHPYPPASYPMCIRISSPGHEADHLHPISPEVRNVWIYTYTPPCTFMVLLHCC
jgi:hypothetical protein